MRPGVRRDMVGVLRGAYDVGERRACSATGFGRPSHRYRSRRDPQVVMRMRLRDLAASRVRHGYRRLHGLLRREGWSMNHKRIYRLHAEEGLSIRTKLHRRKRAWRCGQGKPRSRGRPRTLVHGLHVRPAVRRAPVPDPDHGGRAHARGALDRSKSEFPGVSCGRGSRPARAGPGQAEDP